ncbi:MAG TPA: hypothetical protein VFG46_23595 [Chryseolinea sp.]|nr:hypothetical protein [Chryseolinea sp.]
MKYACLFAVLLTFSIMPIIAVGQSDTTAPKKDTTAAIKMDSTLKTPPDTAAAVKVNVDTAVVAIPMNCYKQYLDYFTELGAKPVTDGMQLVVIAFKKKESCHCFMGRVEVVGGKIKTPLYVQSEGGDYKSFGDLGKKLNPEFLSAVGDGLWNISNGMSVVFQTTDDEYGRLFFYKFLNKNKQMNKEAPSPSELLKN